MAKFYSTVSGMMVGGPFPTHAQAQSFGIKYARENGIQQYKMQVEEV